MAAARCGKKLCLEALIKASANVNKATQQGGTALMLAAQYGKTPCLEALIKAGACLDTQSNTGKTAAEWAANFPHIQNLLKKEREERERITKLADTHCEKIKYIIQYPMKFRMLGFPKTDYVTPGDFKTILTQLNRLKTWRPMQLISRACAPFLDKTLETSEHEPPIENTAPQQEQTPTPKKAKNMKGNQSKQNYPLFQTMRTNQRRLEAYLQEPLKIDNYAELFAWSNLCHIIPKSMDLTPAPTGLKLGLLQNTQQATHTSVFFMCFPDQVKVFADCAVNLQPTVDELAEIAIQSAHSAKLFGIEPKVAMISYSSGGSGQGERVEQVKQATDLVRQRCPEMPLDGPLQYDAAVSAEVAKKKVPDSQIAGEATVMIFPDLNTGNTTYKAVQRSADLLCFGPMLQGLKKPVNDLSRGAKVDDIVYTIALTAIQATQTGH